MKYEFKDSELARPLFAFKYTGESKSKFHERVLSHINEHSGLYVTVANYDNDRYKDLVRYIRVKMNDKYFIKFSDEDLHVYPKNIDNLNNAELLSCLSHVSFLLQRG